MIFQREHGPSIIVPIMGTTAQVLVEEAIAAEAAGADVVEWRIDFLFGQHPNFSFGMMGKDIIPQLLAATKIPLLLTIRTSIQGGEIKLSPGRYRLLMAEMLDTLMQEHVDPSRIAIDIEHWYSGAAALAKRAQDLGYTVVVSDHNWSETPHADIMQIMYEEMLAIPGVVAKLAVTALNEDDVDRLLSVTKLVTLQSGRPVIAIAMGPLGTRSRLEGWKYGSIATFAAVHRASAPGQPAIGELQRLLEAEGVRRFALPEADEATEQEKPEGAAEE